MPLRAACLKLNIQDASINIKWQRDFANFGLEGLEPKPKGRPRSMSNFKHKSDKPLAWEEELVLEHEALRCELDFLKKFQALIQAEEKDKKHKP